MGTFIDDKTIQTIINENYGDVEIIKTTMRISPFGLIGERTYITSYRDSDGEIISVEIPGQLYSKVYDECNIKNN